MNTEIYNNLRKQIDNSVFTGWQGLFVELINLYNLHDDNQFLIQDLTLRCLERRGEFKKLHGLLNILISELGLFPYLDPDLMTSKDSIRMNIFKSPIAGDITFHLKQAEIYYRIVNGENIVLSAPTSFGKSLVIDALISSEEYDNIVVVVPTIALMDELRKKFSKHKEKYKIITQSSQEPATKNLYIYTQERVLECKNLERVDFFIIDEFYKLAPLNTSDYRSDRLNLAFHKLFKMCSRFYMLGPNINGLAEGIEYKINCDFVKYDNYKTVAANEYRYIIREDGNDQAKDIDRDAHLVNILQKIGQNEQILIYCKTPKRAASLVKKILKLRENQEIRRGEFSDWLRKTYHDDWSMADAVERGIACHHGRLPRVVSGYVVEAFNEKLINILVCTSTLIEGVNTNARSVIIYDDCIRGTTQLDSFTFNNISGRSGRMFEHFVGDIHVIGRKPSAELPWIDVPIVTQDDSASRPMLLSIIDELSTEQRASLSKYTTQQYVPIALLNKHLGVPPERIIKFAEALMEKCGAWNSIMAWTGKFPTSEQLRHLCNIMFDYFAISRMGGGCVKSKRQLFYRVLNIVNRKEDRDLIQSEYDFWSPRNAEYEIDDAVQSVFDFKRNLIGYNLPKIILAINDVQRLIFSRFNYRCGDYAAFAHSLEAMFLPPSIVALEEFGIPTRVAQKIYQISNVGEDATVDLILEQVRSHPGLYISKFEKFEKTLLNRAIQYL